MISGFLPIIILYQYLLSTFHLIKKTGKIKYIYIIIAFNQTRK